MHASYTPERTMRAARDRYFDVNGFGVDGGYADTWVDFKLGPLRSRSRTRQGASQRRSSTTCITSSPATRRTRPASSRSPRGSSVRAVGASRRRG